MGKFKGINSSSIATTVHTDVGSLMEEFMFNSLIFFFEDPSGVSKWYWDLTEEDTKIYDFLKKAYDYAKDLRPLLLDKVTQIQDEFLRYTLEEDNPNELIKNAILHDITKETDHLEHLDTIHLSIILKYRTYLINNYEN